MSFNIEGTENLKEIFKGFPEKAYRRPVIAGFKKAALPVKRAMVAALPSNLKPLKKIVLIKPGRGLALNVGFYFGKGKYKNKRGQSWDPYQLAYWHNYGTLKSRSATHTFRYPIRKKSQNRLGVAPGLFVERAWENSKNEVQKIFEDTLDKEITKFFEKEALK